MTKNYPYWWDVAAKPALPAIAPLPDECELLIVGGGLTGLSAARTASRLGKQVVVVDAGIPGIGASSRNGGMVGGGHRLSLKRMAAMFGEQLAARMLREAHIDSGRFIRQLMARENIDCDYKTSGRFRGFWTHREFVAAQRALQQLQTKVPVAAEIVSAAEQHQEVATALYRGGIIYTEHGALNPTRWHNGLLKAAQTAGALVQGDAEVLDCSAVSGADSGFNIVTTRGKLRAAKVLLATNGYTTDNFANIKRRVFAVPSFIVATEVLGQGQVAELIPGGRMITESGDRHCYYRASPDGTRLVFGGRAALMPIADAVAQQQLRRLMAQIFPQLQAVNFSHSWCGFTGFSFDYLPHVGCYDKVWVAMGYSGNGNTMAPYLGHKAALAIFDSDESATTAFCDTPFSTRWWHRGTPWFLPFANVLFRGKDICNNAIKHFC